MIRPLLGLALLMVSCTALQAPAPIRRPATPHTWDTPESTLVVPLRVPQAQVKSWTEGAVPLTIKGEGSGKRTLTAWFMKHDWHYWWTYDLKRSPLKLGFEGSRIRVTTSLTGDLSARWDTLPGDIVSEVEADAGVEAELTLGTDWKLAAKTQMYLEVRRAEVPIGIAWDGNFFGETISIVGPVREALKPSLDKLNQELAKRLSTLDLKPTAEAAWRDLQEPRSLSAEGNLWLNLGPQSVALGPLTTSSDYLSVDLTLTTRPTLTLGPRPSVAKLVLPAVQSSVARTSRLLLNLPVALPWNQLSQTIRDKVLSGGEWNVGSGGRLNVQGLEIFTDGDRVLFRVEGQLTPPWPGTKVDAVLWLGARPVWDPLTRTLRLTETALELKTKDYLTKTAGWLLAGSWVKEWEKHFVWDLGPELNQLKEQASSSLSTLTVAPHLSLSVGFDRWDVVDFALTERGVEVLVRIEGNAVVTYLP